MMTSYDWRRFWQPITRGGFEVPVCLRTKRDDGWQYVIIKNGYMTNPLYCGDDGRYNSDGTDDEFDLLPVEQPAEVRTDTDGRDVTGLYGLHDESDTVNTIAVEQPAELQGISDDGLLSLGFARRQDAGFWIQGDYADMTVVQLQHWWLAKIEDEDHWDWPVELTGIDQVEALLVALGIKQPAASTIATLTAERDRLRDARDGLHDLFLQRGEFCQSLVDQLQILESAIRLVLPVVAHPDIEGTLQDALKRANARRQQYESQPTESEAAS